MSYTDKVTYTRVIECDVCRKEVTFHWQEGEGHPLFPSDWTHVMVNSWADLLVCAECDNMPISALKTAAERITSAKDGKAHHKAGVLGRNAYGCLRPAQPGRIRVK